MARKRKQGTILHLAIPTARVRVDEMRRHPVYSKQYRTSKSFLTHVANDLAVNVGDVVTIEEIRPVSKRKSWQIIAVVKASELSLRTKALEEQV
jgi:small subunit ribosomal protein S17